MYGLYPLITLFGELKEVKEFVELLNQGKTESDTNSYEHSHTTMKVLDKIRSEIGLIYPNDQN
ncbi:hypothetical protein [Bacillus sp. V3B]|uniref:hypothetical protein n=1 Tax=Bacillus sp. V3B TaxID=2804915 RepID=UPI00210AFF09|nr:hypothetical protein [Bacillus sp. V3B]